MSIRLEERAPTRAFWRSHFEVWELSGLTQREYCERHGLSLKNFGNWRAQLKREDAVGPKARWGRYPRLRPMTSPMTKVRTKAAPERFFGSPSTAAISSVKVSGEPAGRRRFSEEAKKRIVEETCCPGASPAIASSAISTGRKPAPSVTGATPRACRHRNSKLTATP